MATDERGFSKAAAFAAGMDRGRGVMIGAFGENGAQQTIPSPVRIVEIGLRRIGSWRRAGLFQSDPAGLAGDPS